MIGSLDLTMSWITTECRVVRMDVRMVRQIRDAHYEQLKDKSVEERLAYYREKSKTLRSDSKNQKDANS